jgi:two-component system sensor histidine kinase KdpD
MIALPRYFRSGLGRSVIWSAGGAVGVIVLTFTLHALGLNLATASFCFLLEVVLLSLAGDFASSAVVSVLAFASLSYVFAFPPFSFRIASPLDVIGIVAFLVTGLIITRLVTKLRAKSESTRLQKEHLQQLYDLAQQLLALEPDVTGGRDFLEPFLGVFGVRAVCLYDAMSSKIHIAGSAGRHIEKKTEQVFIRARDMEDPDLGISGRCIRVGSRTIGAIGFEGLQHPELTGGPLAALAAAQLEKTHSFVKASRAAAAAQTETYRTAVLDALAHEFKTPLATILAAAGSLREVDSLGPHYREMAETVESEAARLGRLTSRLLRTARLEREAVKPWIELIDVSEVIADTVEQYQKQSVDHQISIVKDCVSSEALADPELLRLAVSQLLDNACKYSAPGSLVSLQIARQDHAVALRVISRGNPVPAGERGRIFDRFYRGIVAGNTHGTGLGLYVARKIALALGGDLDLDSERSSTEGTTFRLTLPLPESEPHDLAAAR